MLLMLPWNSTHLDASAIAGYLSIACWICVYTPQMLENYLRKSGEGLSLSFILLWLVGDTLNIIGVVITDLLFTMFLLAGYYVVADIILILQVLYYRKRRTVHRDSAGSVSSIASYSAASSNSESTSLLDKGNARSNPVHYYKINLIIFCNACIFTGLIWSRMWMGSEGKDYLIKSLRVVIPWASAFLYVTSRIPQIIKNFRSRSCEGLSLSMFYFSVLGNVSYCLSILLHSLEASYLLASLPFFLGSLGTLFFDITIFVQFYLYRDNIKREQYHVLPPGQSDPALTPSNISYTLIPSLDIPQPPYVVRNLEDSN
ncbi:uncharacterized protein VTP21DRAFT_4481 [Calcarisporiella thermophila]|uniref:uncharacterized protein n=1 Tax=Calcarisporiella thermophila TaxID=911321 RepID=UPI003743D8EC